MIRTVGLLVAALIALSLVLAPGAFAAQITVNTVADVTADDGECTLREAAVAANGDAASGIETGECAAGSGADTVAFDSTFTGAMGTSTIDVDASINVDGALSIDGGNCGTATTPKPCVGLNVTTGTTPGMYLFGNGISINGIAFTHDADAHGAGILSNGDGDATVTGSWFGVKLDGTTLAPSDAGGIELRNLVFGNTGGTIGGDTPAERNVFAATGPSSSALSVIDSGGRTISGNYFGTLPNGTPVGSPGGEGISLFNSPDNTIGGDADTAGECDGECNLVVGYSGDGIAIDANTSPSSGTNVFGNFVGLELDGATAAGNGGAGIRVGDSENATIGGSALSRRNHVVGNGSAGILLNEDTGGISIGSGATGFSVVNNYVGVSADGTVALPNTNPDLPGVGGSGIRSIASGGSVIGNRFGGNGLSIRGDTTLESNVIGVGVGGEALGIAGEPGLRIDGNGNTVGDASGTKGNTVGNVLGEDNPAILLTGGASSNSFKSNLVGTTANGTPAPNGYVGIELGGFSALSDNVIGATAAESAAAENVISNSGGDAIRYGDQGGTGNQFLRNVGRNNGSTVNDLFVDIGSDNEGNEEPSNGGVEGPSGLSATAASLSGGPGSAEPGATVLAFATFTDRGDVRKYLGTTVASGDGSWTFVFAAPLPAGQCVTANQIDTDDNGSELAEAKTIGGGPCQAPPYASISSGPAAASTTPDSTPGFTFGSTEPGASFECRIDLGAFTTCPASYTTPALADGSHTLTVRARVISAAALGSDVGKPISRTFTVDTTAPVTTIDSGPAPGSTISSASPSIAFSASEAGASFECSVDGGAFAACASPAGLTLGDGSHSFRARATDAAGNAGPAVERSFSVDTSAPAVKVTKAPKKRTKSRTAKFAFSSNEAGASFACKLDKKAVASCGSPTVYKKLKPGTHSFKVTATDSAGNVGAAKTVRWKVLR